MPIDITRLALIGAQLIGLGNELIEMSDSTKPPDDEVLWLARAIQGEGAALFGDSRDEDWQRFLDEILEEHRGAWERLAEL